MSPKYCFLTIAHCFDMLESNTWIHLNSEGFVNLVPDPMVEQRVRGGRVIRFINSPGNLFYHVQISG